MKIKNNNKLHSSVTILALAVASIFGELYSVDINAAPTPTPTPHPTSKRTKFTSEEDEKLRELVEAQGISDWELIANNMPGRSPRQCRERYLNYVSPDVHVNFWTEEEDEVLLKGILTLGPKWNIISNFLPNRSETDTRNRYFSIRNDLARNFRLVALSLLENNIGNNARVSQRGINYFLNEIEMTQTRPLHTYNLVPHTEGDSFEIQSLLNNDRPIQRPTNHSPNEMEMVQIRPQHVHNLIPHIENVINLLPENENTNFNLMPIPSQGINSQSRLVNPSTENQEEEDSSKEFSDKYFNGGSF